MTFAEWQKSGRDKYSIIADPLFMDPLNLDFNFKSIKLAKRIGFIPFDYSRAGVYGSDEWKKLAAFDPELVTSFDEAIVLNEKRGN